MADDVVYKRYSTLFRHRKEWAIVVNGYRPEEQFDLWLQKRRWKTKPKLKMKFLDIWFNTGNLDASAAQARMWDSRKKWKVLHSRSGINMRNWWKVK